MNVDPAILRAFSGMLGKSAGVLDGIDALVPFRNSEGVVNGTDFDEANALSAAAVAAAVQGLAGRLGSVAEIAAGVANDYQVAESEFTEKLASMGGPK
ncbi:MAG: hypothetical protein ACJA07_001682 [Rhodococcus sp. (in: high G+C Gram-positive bacteria)]